MTGRLVLSITPEASLHGPVAYQVLGAGTRRTGALAPYQPAEEELPIGDYVVLATLPTGSQLTAVARVEDTSQTDVLLGGLSQVRADETDPRDAARVAIGSETKDLTWDSAIQAPSTSLAPGPQAWVRLWSGLLVSDLQAEPEIHESGAVTFPLSPGMGLYSVQVGGPHLAWRTICLPPSYSATLTVTASPDKQGFDDGVHVTASGSSTWASSLFGYLESGQNDAAAALAPELVRLAQQMFHDKAASCEGAAAAGYFLLRVGQQETIGDWPERFADGFGWLPDAHVIHATQLLRRPGAPDLDLARSRLMSAVQAGQPPRYTEGLRMLFEDLQLLAAADPSDEPVAAALAVVREYAAACDWTAVHTTYWAQRPSEPTLERIIGWPKDPTGWHRIPNAKEVR